MHKPRSQGGEVSQMSTLYNNSYLVKVATKGGGGSKFLKKWLRGLCMTPNCILGLLCKRLHSNYCPIWNLLPK